MTTVARLRASDQDRHEAILALSDHHAEGRLDLAEFTARMERAQEATYVVDLDPLFVDLPARAVATYATDRRPVHQHRLRRHHGPPPWLPVAVLVVIGLSVAAVVNGHFPWWLIPIGWFLAMRIAAHRHHRHYSRMSARPAVPTSRYG